MLDAEPDWGADRGETGPVDTFGGGRKTDLCLSVAVLPRCLKPYMKLCKRHLVLAEENQVPNFHLIKRKAGVKLGFLVGCISY